MRDKSNLFSVWFKRLRNNQQHQRVKYTIKSCHFQFDYLMIDTVYGVIVKTKAIN